jgi:hypothetical protein
LKLSKRHKKGKKPIHIILLWFFIFLFFFKNFFSPSLYTCQLAWIRHEVKEKLLFNLPDEQLIQINKPLSFNENEFEQNGVMYDVVKTVITKDKKVLYCFLDGNETSLNSDFENSFSLNFDNNPFKKDIVSKIMYFFKLVIICQDFSKLDILFSYETKKLNLFSVSKLPSWFKNKIIPPPIFY